MNIKEYYNYVIKALDQFSVFSGSVAYLSSNVLDDFEFKYSEYLVDVDRNATFLFDFDLSPDAPENVYKELLEIYADYLVGLSDMFLNIDKKNADANIELSRMIGELE